MEGRSGREQRVRLEGKTGRRECREGERRSRKGKIGLEPGEEPGNDGLMS